MGEAIFFEEEGARRRFMPIDILGDADDVAAGAKAAALGMVDQDDPNVGIVAPFDQRARHVPHHLAVEAVQCLRTVEAEPPGEAFLDSDHVGSRHGIHQGIIT